MSGLETVAIALGTSVVRTAGRIWLGDHQIALEAGSTLLDQVKDQLISQREMRKFRRVWEQAAELVVDRIEPVIVTEFRDLTESEKLAAVDAVRATFDIAELTEADLYAKDLDAGFLNRHLRRQDPQRASRSGFRGSSYLGWV